MVRTTRQPKQPTNAPSRTADAQRQYRRQTAVAVGPDAEAHRSKEKKLYRECQARALVLAPLLPHLQLPSRMLTSPRGASVNGKFNASDNETSAPASVHISPSPRPPACPLSRTPCWSTFPSNGPRRVGPSSSSSSSPSRPRSRGRPHQTTALSCNSSATARPYFSCQW